LSLASTPPTKSSGTTVVADGAGSLGMTVHWYSPFTVQIKGILRFAQNDKFHAIANTLQTMSAREFNQSVLALRPGIAVFDCDGTLWSNNSGEDFFYWSMEQGLVSDEVVRWAKARYDDYRADKVDEAVMCGEMTTMYAGQRVSDMEAAAERFFRQVVKPNYFLEMQQLTLALHDQGCELWAVSSTNEWVVSEGIKDFGIPPANVLAATAECAEGIITSKLTRMPSGEGKARLIREVIARPVDAVFGNSVHDAAMLRLARHAFAVNPTKELEQIARESGWTVYWPVLAASS
jgi:phosphoserine phosphatase